MIWSVFAPYHYLLLVTLDLDTRVVPTFLHLKLPTHFTYKYSSAASLKVLDNSSYSDVIRLTFCGLTFLGPSTSIVLRIAFFRSLLFSRIKACCTSWSFTWSKKRWTRNYWTRFSIDFEYADPTLFSISAPNSCSSAKHWTCFSTDFDKALNEVSYIISRVEPIAW